MTLPGGSTKQFEYDPLMRVKSITAKDPGQNDLLNYQYSHDKVDNITQKATEHGDYDYDYDDLYRLMSADPATGGNEAFTYDGVGNRLTAKGVTGDWSYSINNELTGYDDVSYVYDANGNTTNKGNGTSVTKYIYNTEDRLTEVRDVSDALIASYYYDPFGRRLWKEVSGVRTYFHYADEGLVGEYDSTGNEIKTYGYKPGSTWTTDPLFMKVGNNYYFYHNDHLGTPQMMTGVNGAVVWSATYSSFGEATIDPFSTISNPLRFPGQYYDQETCMHYNWHRYYNTTAGRYLSADPVGFDGGINIYLYALSNPLKHIDTYGLEPLNPYLPATPRPDQKKCIEKIREIYAPRLQTFIDEYKDCSKRCDIIKEFKCMDSFAKAKAYADCKVGCFVIYKIDSFPTQTMYALRIQICTIVWGGTHD